MEWHRHAIVPGRAPQAQYRVVEADGVVSAETIVVGQHVERRARRSPEHEPPDRDLVWVDGIPSIDLAR